MLLCIAEALLLSFDAECSKRDNQWSMDASNRVYMTATVAEFTRYHTVGSQDVQDGPIRTQRPSFFLLPMCNEGLPGGEHVADFSELSL